MPVEELARIEALRRDWPGLARLRRALWLNMLAPGVGLIALQRPGRGLAVAVAFFLSCETALLGALLIPLLLGHLATAAGVLAAVVWLMGQVLLLRRSAQLQDPQRQLLASARIEQARQSLAAGELREAEDLLASAAVYDDEQPDLNWLLAKVFSTVGPPGRARRQWRRLDQVDRRGRCRQEIHHALSAVRRVAESIQAR